MKDKQLVKKRYWLRGGLIMLIIGMFTFFGRLFISRELVFIHETFALTPFGTLFVPLISGCSRLITNYILFLIFLIVPSVIWYFLIGIILGLVYSYFKKKFVNYKSWFVFFLIIFILLLLLLQFIIGHYTHQYALSLACPTE